MAAEVITGAFLQVATHDISPWCTDITLERSSDALEDTAFGDTARSRVGGLEDGSLSFTFHMDYAANATYEYINDQFNQQAACVLRKDSAAAGATNPQWSFSCLVNDWKPLDASVGQLHGSSVTWPLVTAVTETP